jgi:hypothetical protein
MLLIPVEDVETIRDVTSIFLSGDHESDSSDDQNKWAIEEEALKKYDKVQIVGNDDGVKWDVTLPEGHCIVKVVTRIIMQWEIGV